jgi:hypothetical protein
MAKLADAADLKSNQKAYKDIKMNKMLFYFSLHICYTITHVHGIPEA